MKNTVWKKVAGGLLVLACLGFASGCDRQGSGATGAASSAAPASAASGP